jgi:lipopolysaccharide/colanic/teichoic acid biosynthesis glycosyltransferase
LLSPLFVIITIGLFIASRNRFFSEVRQEKVVFKIIKFKTMNDKRTVREICFRRVRLTKIGSFVRKTSLDEIPQLLNVIKRRYEFDGRPRPLLVQYPTSLTQKAIMM